MDENLRSEQAENPILASDTTMGGLLEQTVNQSSITPL